MSVISRNGNKILAWFFDEDDYPTTNFGIGNTIYVMVAFRNGAIEK